MKAFKAFKALSFFLTCALAVTQGVWLAHYFPGPRSWLLAILLSFLIGWSWRRMWGVP